jgi:hypothetical protein
VRAAWSFRSLKFVASIATHKYRFTSVTQSEQPSCRADTKADSAVQAARAAKAAVTVAADAAVKAAVDAAAKAAIVAAKAENAVDAAATAGVAIRVRRRSSAANCKKTW